MTTLLSDEEVEVRVTREAVERTVAVEGSSVVVSDVEELEEGEGEGEGDDELVEREEGTVVVLRVVVVVTGATVVVDVDVVEEEEDDDLVRGVAKGVVELEAASVVEVARVVVLHEKRGISRYVAFYRVASGLTQRSRRRMPRATRW